VNSFGWGAPQGAKRESIVKAKSDSSGDVVSAYLEQLSISKSKQIHSADLSNNNRLYITKARL
jgi:hypothetical protein